MFLNTTFRTFRHRDYSIFWCGLFLGHTGVLIQTTAQSWLIFQLTNSPFYLGLGLGLLLMTPGAGAILGGLSLASMRRFPRLERMLFCLAAGFGSAIVLFAVSRDFPLSLAFLFIAGAFQTTFLSTTATLLQVHADETNRGRIMSLVGLINRGLGPMGSFPFGLIAPSVGAPWTVAGYGFPTVAAVAYLVLFRSALHRAQPGAI